MGEEMGNVHGNGHSGFAFGLVEEEEF